MFLLTAQSSKTILFVCISSANKHSKLSRAICNSLQKRCTPSRFLGMKFALKILQVPIKTLTHHCHNSFPLGVGLLKFVRTLCLSNDSLDPGPSIVPETVGLSQKLPCQAPSRCAVPTGGQSTSFPLRGTWPWGMLCHSGKIHM